MFTLDDGKHRREIFVEIAIDFGPFYFSSVEHVYSSSVKSL